MFQSVDGPTIEFYNPNNTQNAFDENEESPENENNNKVKTSTVPTEEKSVSTEIIDKVEEGIQLNLKDLFSNKTTVNYDENKLKSFLENAYSLINHALNTQIRDLYIEDESDEINAKNFQHHSLFKFPTINMDSNTKNKKIFISDMVWNKNGDTLAVSFYEDVHIGPCAHGGVIKFFIFNSFYSKQEGEEQTSETVDYKNIELETNSCIKCLDSHPKINNIFIAGGYNGEIYYINLSKGTNTKDYIEYISKIDSAFYKECIISLRFIKYDENIYYISSISTEGRLLLWNPEHHLKYPILGFNLEHKIGRNLIQLNPTAFINNPFETCDFRIGTYDGSIYKCNFTKPNFDTGNTHQFIFKEKKGVVWRNDVRIFISNMKEKDVSDMKNTIEKKCRDRKIANLTMEEFLKLRPDINKIYQNAIKYNFEKHFSPLTSINFNFFVKNLIVTTSYDGGLRLYHGDEKNLKFFYEKICEQKEKNKTDIDYYTYSTWSPYKPNILVTGNSRGEIEFGILTNKKTLHNISSIQNNGVSPVVKIVFNPNENSNQNIMSVCYKDGIVELFKLSDSFAHIGMNEIENLSKIITY